MAKRRIDLESVEIDDLTALLKSFDESIPKEKIATIVKDGNIQNSDGTVSFWKFVALLAQQVQA